MHQISDKVVTLFKEHYYYAVQNKKKYSGVRSIYS